MPLVLRQTFPLGRFHATRWNQNPFEDRFGEWPPSPWRLLRALVARWFQYSRETGDEDVALRDADRGLSAGEKSMLVKARGVLVSELSFALDVSEDDALDQVSEQLS